jgi:acyl-CoA thioester hydrolase
MISAEIAITIPFHDVDALEIVWHGHYVRYLELARCAALKLIDYDYQRMRESGYSWPVIDMKLRYPKPAHFDQRVLVKAELVEWENRMLFRYEVVDAETRERLTVAETTQVAVDLKTREMCFESPPVLFRKLGLEPPPPFT